MVVQHNQPGSTDQSVIRNFCIIAHIDHGKSTARRPHPPAELASCQSSARCATSYLDRMDIEQRAWHHHQEPRAVRVPWAHKTAPEYALGMIDTPGHVDFTYEVSRSLAACEGAVLLIDAAQGIEAQTLANLYLALENDLAIIPVLNKIDLPGAQPEKYAHEVAQLIGCERGRGAARSPARPARASKPFSTASSRYIPAPRATRMPRRARMIFDSVYDTYRGVVTYVRVVDGVLSTREHVRMMSTGATHEPLELGVISTRPEA